MVINVIINIRGSWEKDTYEFHTILNVFCKSKKCNGILRLTYFFIQDQKILWKATEFA